MDEIIKAIQLGQLKPGFQFPGTRKLAEDLKLNRNTIVKSFEELAALGWIEILPNKGTFVSQQNHIHSPEKILHSESNFPDKATFTIHTSNLLDAEKEPNNFNIKLNEGKVDQRLAAYKISYKAYQNSIKRKINSESKLENDTSFFTKQLINYLKITRNLNLKSDQIHIVSSREMALQLINKIILQPNESIALSKLNDYKTNQIFQSNQNKLALIETNEKGLDLEHFKKKLSDQTIKALYLSSLHQYPTTSILPSDSVAELIKLVKSEKIALIEENSFFDFYYTNRPLLPISASILTENAIYIGDFGQILTPAYQFNFIIGPSDFIAECKKLSTIYNQGIDSYILQTIGTLISEGEISRITKKHRKIYRERRELMGNLLLQYFGKAIELKLPKIGLGLWIEWKTKINLMQLKRDALAYGLHIPQHLLYQTKEMIGLRIGFGSLNDEEIKRVVHIIFECYSKQKTQS